MLASLPTVSTRLVVFDTEVVDLTDQLADPVDILFGTQLGGGTDINRAVGYRMPRGMTRAVANHSCVDLRFVSKEEWRSDCAVATAAIVASGVTMICLLALNDDGAPCFDENLAASMTSLGGAAFACTPDLFPDLMATAIHARDLCEWASRHDINVHLAIMLDRAEIVCKTATRLGLIAQRLDRRLQLHSVRRTGSWNHPAKFSESRHPRPKRMPHRPPRLSAPAADRIAPLTFEIISSIGVRSGLHGGSGTTCAPAASTPRRFLRLVRLEIVPDHHVAALQFRDQDVGHVGLEDVGVGGTRGMPTVPSPRRGAARKSA